METLKRIIYFKAKQWNALNVSCEAVQVCQGDVLCAAVLHTASVRTVTPTL